jgi:hypothetical protein
MRVQSCSRGVCRHRVALPFIESNRLFDERRCFGSLSGRVEDGVEIE